ncbi:CG34136 [Drosophila busckii]|uniref:CG34136 n=1 Tax=Drosophila busckii TaxID=30019 RepID=A0A0M4EEB9_DROBS|nr:CG34136 [Drosophila busckii]
MSASSIEVGVVPALLLAVNAAISVEVREESESHTVSERTRATITNRSLRASCSSWLRIMRACHAREADEMSAMRHINCNVLQQSANI